MRTEKREIRQVNEEKSEVVNIRSAGNETGGVRHEDYQQSLSRKELESGDVCH